jgi:lipoprotein-anchoring transpeptidase ErfK/SrfK
MISARRVSSFVALTLALMLAVGIVPVFAEPTPATVLYHVTMCGTDLIGMDATQAVAAISTACTSETLKPLDTVAAGSHNVLDVSTAVDVDPQAMAQTALLATQDTTLEPTVDATAVAAFVARIAKAVDRKQVDAQRSVKKKRLKVSAPSNGRSVDKKAAIAAITAAINAEIAAAGAVQPAVVIPVKTLVAKGPLTLGKTIIIVLGERKLYLYKNSKLEKTFRCAVGQKRYPTPLGTWKITKKVKNPSWYNNGAAWARKMAAYIPPGRNNPLGTRALYLNADGIRIHGIPASENSSIGHAASHGCIRLKNSDALKIFPLVPVGTRVYIVK